MDTDGVTKIEGILKRQVDVMTETFDHKVDEISDKFEQTVKHHMGIMAEDFQHKLDIVAEGQQMPAEKLDMTRQELKTDIHSPDRRLTMVEARLEKKLDAVAADLAAHRADTAVVKTELFYLRKGRYGNQKVHLLQGRRYVHRVA